ncbi:MAG: hypothetical protein ABI638_11260 [Ignavibacteriota bacterium]
MKKYAVVLVFLFCFQSLNIFAQEGFSDILGTSHYTRAIRLGNAYTGVAEGTESIYYNVAGLANLNGYSALYSNGSGVAFYLKDIRINDYAVSFRLPGKIGMTGISIQTLSSPSNQYNFSMDIYSLSYARKVISDFSAGITFNYYYAKIPASTTSNPEPTTGESASSFDLNLGLLYNIPENLKISSNDKFKIGLQIKNLLNSSLSYRFTDFKAHLFQEIRAGLSYMYNPNFEKVYDLAPIMVLFSFDAVFQGADYDFTEWQPNYGIEATLFEVLQLSYGRENENQIKETYSYSPQHPVNRFGIGLNIPLNYLLDFKYDCNLSVNYSISDWQKIDEDKGIGYPFNIDKFDKNTFSVGIVFSP